MAYQNYVDQGGYFTNKKSTPYLRRVKFRTQ